MRPAAKWIKAAGGIAQLARHLGVDRSWVWRWTQPLAKRGTAGRIPASQHDRLLRLSRRQNWRLGKADLVGGGRA